MDEKLKDILSFAITVTSYRGSTREPSSEHLSAEELCWKTIPRVDTVAAMINAAIKTDRLISCARGYFFSNLIACLGQFMIASQFTIF
jgi:hypothetical protein